MTQSKSKPLCVHWSPVARCRSFRLVSGRYLEVLDLVLEPLVLRVQVLHAMLGLAQLGLQLGLQLPAALLKLQQLLLRLLAAASRPKEKESDRARSGVGGGDSFLYFYRCGADPDNIPLTDVHNLCLC